MIKTLFIAEQYSDSMVTCYIILFNTPSLAIAECQLYHVIFLLCL
ncbi:hypothetical protein yrohd0001_23770 [Yersinia rohdei ATCC 43380]|nr:hypothetical protein yrohd0001_23770 [Yersinia rohdei ATCC 43380]